MATLVFNYSADKVDKLDELAQNESRTRSNYIQIILHNFLLTKDKEVIKKKKVKVKKKGDQND